MFCQHRKVFFCFFFSFLTHPMNEFSLKTDNFKSACVALCRLIMRRRKNKKKKNTECPLNLCPNDNGLSKNGLSKISKQLCSLVLLYIGNTWKFGMDQGAHFMLVYLCKVNIPYLETGAPTL